MRRWIAVILLASLGLAQSPPALSVEQSLALLQQSPSWRAADLGVLGAQRNLSLAQSAAGLNLLAGAEQTLGRDATNGITFRGSNFSATLATNVLPWSPAQDNIRAAQRALDRAVWQRDETRNTLVLGLVERYFGVRTARFDLALAEGARALAERRLQIVSSQATLGQVRQDAILNAQLSLQEALTRERQARSGLEITRRALETLLGRPLGGNNLSSPPPQPSAPEALETLLRRALERRPDILRAVSSLQDAQDGLDIARRDRWLPEATLQTFYGEFSSSGSQAGPQVAANLNFKSGDLALSASTPAFADPNPNDPNNPRANRLGLRLSLSVPLVFPSNDARTQAAGAGLEAAQSGLELARLQAELEVRQRFGELSDAEAQRDQVSAGLEAASERLRVARARLESGLGTRVEVEAAELGVHQAEREVFATAVSIYLAALRLEVAAGNNIPGGIQ
ncbi:MAG: TolC family protein [Meiothermus sp.]|nr:TolC family protein [Meiothermus sp.]